MRLAEGVSRHRRHARDAGPGGTCSAAVLDACEADSRSDRTSGPGVSGSQGTRCRPRRVSQSVSQSIDSQGPSLKKRSRPRLAMQGRVSLSALYTIGQDGSPHHLSPIRPWREPWHPLWRSSPDTRKQQKLNLGRQWPVVSRISQMQAWAIPAVRKSTDPHCGPLICCLAARALCQCLWERVVCGVSAGWS